MERTMRQTRTSNTQFTVREEGNERRIEGYFAVFGSTYELFPGGTESIDPHAFDGALGDDIRCLVDHDTRLVLGRNTAGTLTLRADDHGLWASVLINPDDSDATNMYARNKRGDVTQGSFGFDILDEETEIREDGSVHWTIRKVKLYEVSVVTFPAYKETGVAARKASFDAIQKRQGEVWRAKMLDRLHRAGKNGGNENA